MFSIGYDFHLGTGDNGNIFAITNNRDHARDQTFAYDALNRLTSAQNAGTDCSITLQGKTKFWGNNYSYDAWGNLLSMSVTKCSSENLGVVALANNQVSGYGYDAAGNMTNDPTDGVAATYDAENHIATATKNGVSTTYVYDADGNRVEKSTGSTGTLYWYMTPGIVAESDLAGNVTSEYVFFNGERVARKDFPGSAVFYYFSNHLKSTSLITDATGNIKMEYDYTPWGSERQFTNSDPNQYKFTGKPRDPETQLDYFGARYYSSGAGRFLRPDPAKQGNHPSDPQAWNLYSYALNNPLRYVDPDGKCSAPAVGHGQVGICVEAFIQKKWVLWPGRGDNRGPVGNDKNATFKVHYDIVIDLKSHKIDHHRAAGVSGLFCRNCGPTGTAETSVDNRKVDKNGNVTFTLHATGENGFSWAINPIKGEIDHVLLFKVAPDGSVSIEGGLRKAYPSLEVWIYDDKGNFRRLLFISEHKKEDLDNRPDQEIPPTQPQTPDSQSVFSDCGIGMSCLGGGRGKPR